MTLSGIVYLSSLAYILLAVTGLVVICIVILGTFRVTVSSIGDSMDYFAELRPMMGAKRIVVGDAAVNDEKEFSLHEVLRLVVSKQVRFNLLGFGNKAQPSSLNLFGSRVRVDDSSVIDGPRDILVLESWTLADFEALYNKLAMNFGGRGFPAIGEIYESGDGLLLKNSLRHLNGRHDPRTLVSSEEFASVIELLQEKKERSEGKYSEDNSGSGNPPIRSTHPSRPSPLFGWFLFTVSCLIVAIGFWCTFIFARYQFYVKRVGWGVACLLLGISVIVLSAMLMSHALDLTLHPVPWR